MGDYKFKSGDIVYYIGNEKYHDIIRDVPYYVYRCDSRSKTKYDLYLMKNGKELEFPTCSDLFVSKEVYNKIKNAELSDIEIKNKILVDTKTNRLSWMIPDNKYYNKWYRSFIPLKEPKNAYIRIDVIKMSKSWSIDINYHRNRVGRKFEDGILIKTYTGGELINSIVKRIEEQLEYDDQYYQYRFD